MSSSCRGPIGHNCRDKTSSETWTPRLSLSQIHQLSSPRSRKPQDVHPWLVSTWMEIQSFSNILFYQTPQRLMNEWLHRTIKIMAAGRADETPSPAMGPLAIPLLTWSPRRRSSTCLPGVRKIPNGGLGAAAARASFCLFLQRFLTHLHWKHHEFQSLLYLACSTLPIPRPVYIQIICLECSSVMAI